MQEKVVNKSFLSHPTPANQEDLPATLTLAKSVELVPKYPKRQREGGNISPSFHL